MEELHPPQFKFDENDKIKKTGDIEVLFGNNAD